MTASMLQPLTLGGITIDPPLILAPMAGYTDYPFRTIIRALGGCGLVYTELISSDGITRHNRRTLDIAAWGREERPIAVQLYGSDPAVIAAAAQQVVARGAEIVDINMGCWVPKLAQKGAGAALLRDVRLAARVVDAVVKAVDVPVTVKVRSGWEEERPTALEFARAAEEAGAKLIAVHARYARQGFSGRADWDIIRRVKEAVRIPVIGNGDVTSAADAARMFAHTGCDGVMIGRAARGNPWIFRQIAHELSTGEPLPGPNPAERAAIALHHARLAVTFARHSEAVTVLELRKHFSRYRLDAPGAAELRRDLLRCESLAGIEALLSPLAAEADPASAWLATLPAIAAPA